MYIRNIHIIYISITYIKSSEEELVTRMAPPFIRGVFCVNVVLLVGCVFLSWDEELVEGVENILVVVKSSC